VDEDWNRRRHPGSQLPRVSYASADAAYATTGLPASGSHAFIDRAIWLQVIAVGKSAVDLGVTSPEDPPYPGDAEILQGRSGRWTRGYCRDEPENGMVAATSAATGSLELRIRATRWTGGAIRVNAAPMRRGWLVTGQAMRLAANGISSCFICS
jgi:hypothetical protein